MSITGGVRPSQTEHALKLTQFAVDHAMEAMFTVSPEGLILSANQAACRRLEYSSEELTGMRIADIDPHYPQELWPQHFEDLRRDRTMKIETQHQSKSGKIYDVEVAIAYFEFEGVEYCCSSIRDITQEKQSQLLLQLQQDVLERIAKTKSDLVETLNELCKLVQELVPNTIATIMLYDEASNALSFAAGPALTPSICKAFEPLVPAENAGSCGSAAFLKRPVIVEDTTNSPHWKDLQDIVEEFGLKACWSIPIFDDQQKILGTFAISHANKANATEFHLTLLDTASHLASIAIARSGHEQQLQLAQSELAHVNRINTMGEMATSIAHELNQPLAAMVNESFVLDATIARGDFDHDEVKRAANSIQQQALRSAEIVNAMRSLVKKSTSQRTRLDPIRVIQDSISLVESEMRQQRVSLTTDFDDGTPQIEVDPIQIQQVIVNLIRNAIESMDAIAVSNRALVIRCGLNDLGEVRIRVEDCGPGIADEQVEALFEPFQTSKSEGMGMGLTISRSIAESHLGQLYGGNRDGGGAVFTLVLPKGEVS